MKRLSRVCIPISTQSMDEKTLITELRAADEAAFVTLIEMYHPSLVRLATIYVDDPAIAEEVVQETWVAVFRNWKVTNK